jgi:hypothetical protein
MQSHARIGDSRAMGAFMVLACLWGLLLTAPDRAVAARPFRGPVHWSIVLCKFSDSPTPPHAADYYQQMIASQGTGGLDDYVGAVSYGSASLQGTVVKGWYTEAHTQATEAALGGAHRTQKYSDCLDAAAHDAHDPYTPPPGQLVAVITSPGIDLFGMPGVGSFLSDDVNLVGMSHEVGHGFGYNHSFSNDTTFQDATWSAPGEYDDPWDMMSAYNVFADPTSAFGGGGPGFNAHHIDEMGWMPRSRIFTAGSNGQSQSTITLAALNHPATSGYLMARVPFDPADLFHYYTVEFRRADGWDSGFPTDTVLIHEIKLNTSDNQYHTYLLRTLGTPDRTPIQSLNVNGVVISVGGVNAATNQATVTISSQIVGRCLQGYVWREGSASDHVCVSGATRSATAAQNAAGPSHRAGGGAYGPDTCNQGFVWRDAFANDHVCVSGAVRTQAAADNAQASNRVNPARITYGPNTCQQGYVWREADDSDYVCVGGAERSTVASENANRAAHRNPAGGPYGPNTCLNGYVWRDSFPGDQVCVTPARRTQVQNDSSQANARLAKPAA